MRNGQDIAGHLQALAAFLRRHQALWEPAPLHHPSPGWMVAHPTLARWCEHQQSAGPEAAETAWQQGDLPDDAPAVLQELVAESQRITDLPALSKVMSSADRPRRVRARKWAQVVGAAAVMAEETAEMRVVDWCGGKGHLGRRLAERGRRKLLLIDRQADLLDAGQVEGRALGIQVDTVCADVLNDDSPVSEVGPGDALVALHACGDLGARALALATRSGLGVLGHAPCCWVRTSMEQTRGASRAGRGCGLHLDAEALRLSTADEGWGPPRRRALRRRALAWRLGLDLLVRQVTADRRYTPVRMVPRSWLGDDFTTFVDRVARRDGLPLPASWSAELTERQGLQAARRVRALGLVRAPFRRPLEVWLVLDRAQTLVEAGWQVEVGTFCASSATPRNLWIRARR